MKVILMNFLSFVY